MGIRPIRWEKDHVAILDQTLLPGEERYLSCVSVEQIAEAIRQLRVRGAPLIGIAAAYGLALAALHRGAGFQPAAALRQRVAEAADLLRATRPTARNLFWAIDRMVAALTVAQTSSLRPPAQARALLDEALAIHREDAETCRLIGEHGAGLVPERANILTICNTGALATGGIGTAYGIIRTAHEQGKQVKVLACETRPLLQGARLTMWELMRDSIPGTLITDSMAATAMRLGMTEPAGEGLLAREARASGLAAAEPPLLVIAGADTIARNGDAANKIGTYALAVLARHHGLPFYVAAPMSSVALDLPDGSHIVIERRSAREIAFFMDQPAAPSGARIWNPSFDVTPAELITAIITERGVARPPYGQSLPS
jgi:methylthioribose-1-phosphate isomerase